MMKRIIAVLTALMMLISAAALAEGGAEDPVLVTVNGQELRQSSEEYRVWQDYLTYQAGQDAEEYAAMIQQYAMDYAIRYAAMAQKLNEMGNTVPEEELNAGREEARAGWESIVADIMQSEFGTGADATDEEKAAAKADALAYILDNYGYTEESYVEEAMMYTRLNAVYDRGQKLAAEGIEVTDQEVEDHFRSIVEEDETFLKQMVQPEEGEEKTPEEMSEELVQAYEFYNQYYGYDFKYQPEGYRGITHILLKVEQELLDKWQELAAKLEEQNEPKEEVAPETVEATDTEAADAEAAAEPEPTAEPEEPVTPEMVEAARQAILDSVKDTVDEINAKLEAGANFEDLILEYGTDPGMQVEENRTKGYAVHPASIMFEQNFTKGAAALENVGDVSEPIVSQFGVHILHYLRDIPGGAVELTDALKEELRADLQSEKVQAAFDALQEKWVAESEVVWTEAGEDWKIDEAALAAEPESDEPAEETEAVPAE